MADNHAGVLLLDADSELGRLLIEDERQELARVRLPVRHLSPEAQTPWQARLQEEGAFAAIVLQGMLLQRLSVGSGETLRLLGPGDMIILAPFQAPELLGAPRISVAADASVAVLGETVLPAFARWPRLAIMLSSRYAEQGARLATQLAISQLPRVSDRLLGILWLLAESWGRVTPNGVSLPLSLTHDALGGLIGARRSTVTLALGELVERAAIVRQDRGWLLLERLERAPSTVAGAPAPQVIAEAGSSWKESVDPPELGAYTPEQLVETVDRMRRELARSRERVRANLTQIRRNRERVSERRARLSDSGH